jgi:hypothetical protein
VPRILENGEISDFRSMFIDSPHDVNDIPPVRITFPDGSNVLSSHQKDDIIDPEGMHQLRHIHLEQSFQISNPKLLP